MSTYLNDPELNDNVMAFWKELPDGQVVRPSQIAKRKNQRGHVLRWLRLLARHGYVKRVRGGYLNSQHSLQLEGDVT